MKNIVIKSLVAILILLLVVLSLIVYLSSGNLPKDHHAQLMEYPYTATYTDSSFTVMTYNIGYLSGMINNQSVQREEGFFDENLQRAKELLALFSPSIIGFQEIDFGSHRSFNINQLDTLAHRGNYPYGYKSVNWDKKYVPFPYWPPANHFGKMLSGQAILSKYPIMKGDTHILPINETAPAYYRAFYLDRLLQMSEVEYEGVFVRIMNVHLEAYDRDTRLTQIEVVKHYFEKYADRQPVILLGDFNSKIPRRSEEKDAIEVLMEARWITSAIPFEHEEIARTFSSEYPDRMIDYIFYNSNYLKCAQSRVIDEAGQISDHLPVWAQLKLH